MPATERTDEKAWDRYPTTREQNDAYSRMHLASCRHATRMALVSGCQSATIFFPLSGEIVTFSTMGSFVEAITLFDSVDAYYEMSTERLKLDYADVWDEFAADMPWVDGVIERLSALGVRQATLDRFDAAYRRRALNFTRGQNNVAKDFASALEDGIEQWIASVDGSSVGVAMPTTTSSSANGGSAGATMTAAAAAPSAASASSARASTPTSAPTPTGLRPPPHPPHGIVTPLVGTAHFPMYVPPSAGFARGVPPRPPPFASPEARAVRGAAEALVRDALASYAARGRGGVPRPRPPARGARGSRGGF